MTRISIVLSVACCLLISCKSANAQKADNVDLVKKENELLKKENDLLKKEIEGLKKEIEQLKKPVGFGRRGRLRRRQDHPQRRKGDPGNTRYQQQGH
jgi:cell division protein FtsB